MDGGGCEVAVGRETGGDVLKLSEGSEVTSS